MRKKGGYMKTKKLKASFTIEAAVIVPIVMVIIVGIIFIAFHVHDIATMESMNTFALIENANKYNEDTEIIQTELKDKLSSGLIITKNINVESTKRIDGLIVKSCGNFSLPFTALTELFGKNQINESSEITVTNLDGRGALLKNKAIVDGIKKIGEEKA